eukprot:TRINITY_DN4783_c0_g1_i1.p1 TRINITY_DN4783_c0_g1~~TRINITY_DN4783_c0_g1_i1.p1  ORF type:complete len:210 (-),score=37.76 TRINITY_DN4783_c0_g1_i1:49-678(-)
MHTLARWSRLGLSASRRTSTWQTRPADPIPGSVILSTTPKVIKGLVGVAADYTSVSTVGKAEAGLTYRGYSIEALAEHAEFEEVAFLLVRGSLPSQSELTAYHLQLSKFRSLPAPLCRVLEELPKSAHPMDVLRTTCSVLGCIEPEASADDIARVSERLMASFCSAMCYWHHWTVHGKRIPFNTNPGDNMATAFLKLSLIHISEPTRPY